VVERVQIHSTVCPAEAATKQEPVWWRRGLVLVAVLNGVLATAWVTTFDNFHDLVAVYAPVIMMVASPLLTRSGRSFRATCSISAGLLLVLSVLLYFLGLFTFWPSAAILLLAVTPLAGRRPTPVITLLSLAVAAPWSYATWVSHLS